MSKFEGTVEDIVYRNDQSGWTVASVKLDGDKSRISAVGVMPFLSAGEHALFEGELTERTAKLPRFELVKPETVIGRNTVTNMQAGIVYGYIGQVKYLVNRMKKEMGVPDIKVIATGGLAVLVAGESSVIDVMDGLLTLKGLRLIYEKNANC